ncbi:SusC/RagA family TonB-linked outer membrane protein [Fulvivirga lutimaris]|uniref:SusC/RagA family TonB-linked outer membrane protein n=1 Tax=Fulvivirga lutimaris TaxID=1819566 RepID=UPI0012BBADDE|nr:SusC/RagA family TonB-linked outer membrane protein [Fulvivirga lutimaris]MTI41094.1 SusC/RagA family TonB-linked outer membrane protein [Fulvivirga lutimaris]
MTLNSKGLLNKPFILISLLMLVSFSVIGQKITVTGNITAEDDGSALPGVNIVEKGTTNGTVTDIVGNYIISVDPDAVLVLSFLGYATLEVPVDGKVLIDIQLEVDVSDHWPIINIGYGNISYNELTYGISRLTSSNYNQGYIYEPTELWQGKVAGLSIYKRGDNPHEESVMRIRGLTTFDEEAAPLIVIDGVPMATLHNLDPQDIESINVLKDGSATAIYGMRGSQGVIIITTKQAIYGRKISVSANSEVAASVISKKQPVMTASEHIAAGANDLGSSTDWQDEITRTGISTGHHVTISGASESSSFRASTHIRQVEGILLNSGFNQINTRVNLRHRAIDDRLRFDFNIAVTNRKSNFSFPDAFRFANVFSPSAPITFPSGDYYQPILFDNFNPVAILKQNVNLGRRRNTNFGAKIDFDILDGLTATVSVAQQFESNFNGKYYSRNSLYEGYNRGGLAQRYTDDQSFTLGESYLTYYKHFIDLTLNVVAGYSYQEDRFESFGAELGDFPSDELGYNAIGYSADILTGEEYLIDISSTTSPINTIKGIFLRTTLSLDDIATFNVSLRRDQSNKLGENKQSGLFPSAGINLNLLHYLKSLNLSLLNMRLGYGVTGSIPSQYGLANQRFDYSFQNGGTVRMAHDANPDLKWEQKKELNLGIDVNAGPFIATLDLYQRTTSDIINLVRIDPNDFSTGERYDNIGGLKSRGMELMLSYYLGNSNNITWQPSIVLSTSRTLLDGFDVDQEVRGTPGIAGSGNSQLIRIAKGEKIGEIWGPVFDGVDANGYAIFRDTNGDGQLLIDNGTALDPNTDFTSLGNGIPSWELGWSNQIRYRNWELNMFFRGAFGHSLVNRARLGFEPLDLGAVNSYNRVVTDKAVDGLTSSQFSSLYVEKADFLQLDNISLSYSLPLKTSSWMKSLKVNMTVQNAFTITSYTGNNPEPILVSGLSSATFSVSKDVLTPGIDHVSNYAPSRTFMFSLSLGL